MAERETGEAGSEIRARERNDGETHWLSLVALVIATIRNTASGFSAIMSNINPHFRRCDSDSSSMRRQQEKGHC